VSRELATQVTIVNQMKELTRPFRDSWVFIPTLAAALAVALVLLFFKDLDPPLRSTLVPSLVVYFLGNSLVGYSYRALDARNCRKAFLDNRDPGPQPRWTFGIVLATYVAWLGALVTYLAWKRIL